MCLELFRLFVMFVFIMFAIFQNLNQLRFAFFRICAVVVVFSSTFGNGFEHVKMCC